MHLSVIKEKIKPCKKQKFKHSLQRHAGAISDCWQCWSNMLHLITGREMMSHKRTQTGDWRSAGAVGLNFSRWFLTHTRTHALETDAWPLSCPPPLPHQSRPAVCLITLALGAASGGLDSAVCLSSQWNVTAEWVPDLVGRGDLRDFKTASGRCRHLLSYMSPISGCQSNHHLFKKKSWAHGKRRTRCA